MRYQPHIRTRKGASNQSLVRGGEDRASSSWYEQENSEFVQSPHVSVASSQSPLKVFSSKSLGWDERKLQFSRTASQTTNDITTPFSSNTRLSFHSEVSHEGI